MSDNKKGFQLYIYIILIISFIFKNIKKIDFFEKKEKKKGKILTLPKNIFLNLFN